MTGGGPLGHPKIYINLDKPGPHPCSYCTYFLSCLKMNYGFTTNLFFFLGGIRFEKPDDHHH